MEATPFVFADPTLWYPYQQMLSQHPSILASGFNVNGLTEPAGQIKVASFSESADTPVAKQEPKMENPTHSPNTPVPHPPKVKKARRVVSLEEKKQLEEDRRARTNVGNMLLTFLYLKRRSNYHVERLFPDITPAEKEAYYRFIVQLKRNCSGYLNESRLSDLWQPNPELEGLNYDIVRGLSHYFLREELPLAIVTSTRMPRQHRMSHLAMGKRLLRRMSRLQQ